MSQCMNEFDLIKTYFDVQSLTQSQDTSDPFFSLQIGDDCALLQSQPQQQLAISVDTMVCGVHFLAESPADRLGWRSLAVSVSDLAAMGALPKAFTLALTLPSQDEPWLASFSKGLAAAAQHYGIRLIGGDTTRGPLAISVQVIGELPQGQALRRDGAKVGDKVYVSGTLGGAHLALPWLNVATPNAKQQALLAAYFEPISCVSLGMALRNLATAAIDISDGLLADAGHIAARSRVGLCLDASLVPLHVAGEGLFSTSQRELAALSGGDDYQLCFTVPAANIARLEAVATTLGVALTPIGDVVAGEGVTLMGFSGDLPRNGYQHF